MKTSASLLLAIFLCVNHAGYARATRYNTDTLHASRLQPYGRYMLNQQNKLELISSAVHFGVKFQGNQCAVYATVKDPNGHSYIQYELDGIYQQRVRINGNPAVPVIIKASTPGKHTLWIYKATEAHTGPIAIAKLAAPGIQPLSVSKAPLIEFIGNSITCGAAADASAVPCGSGAYHDQHNAYMAYGPRVARMLGANYILSSVSGIGVYRTWNMDGPSMPQVYENIAFTTDSSRKWTFSKYSPAIVSIALGTNDLSTGDGKTSREPFDEKLFIDQYVRFIQLVKSKYPKAQIALLSSPMVKGEARTVLEKSLLAIKMQIDTAYPSDKPVQTFFFPPMEAHGCTGHPSVEDHLILANQLKPFYRQLLK